MPVQCVQTAGRDTCPEGYYALYEHANYNAPCPDGAGPTVGQTVIANESVASLNSYDWHAGLTTSVVNRTKMHLELFIDCAFRGRSMIVTPGQYIDRLPPSFDNAISSARLVAAGIHEAVLVDANGTVTEHVPVGEGIVRRGGLVFGGAAGGQGSAQGVRP